MNKINANTAAADMAPLFECLSFCTALELGAALLIGLNLLKGGGSTVMFVIPAFLFLYRIAVADKLDRSATSNLWVATR